MHMLYAGIPLKMLQALMGHKSISSTEVYTKVFALDVAARHRVQFQMPDADEAYCRNSAQCRTDRPPRTREKCAQKSSNTRNGCSSKTLLCDDGEIELNTPRDRENTFEPQLIKKNQTRITQMDSQILSLYAKGMTTREIVATFKEMYDADVSPTLISKVTDAVKEQVTEWQNRQLDALYPIVYMDCIVVKVRQNGSVISKAVFLALGISTEGQKELLGMWLAENEGAKFWLSVLTELKNRGLQDILIACVDGLKGFPDAINSVYPQTHIQLCIIHMVRNSLKYVSWKDYKAVTSGLKAVYQASTEEAALMALDTFAEAWDCKYPQISKSWRAH